MLCNTTKHCFCILCPTLYMILVAMKFKCDPLLTLSPSLYFRDSNLSWVNIKSYAPITFFPYRHLANKNKLHDKNGDNINDHLYPHKGQWKIPIFLFSITSWIWMTQKGNKWAQNFLTWSPICYTQSSKFFGWIWQYGNPAVLLFQYGSWLTDKATCYF